MLKACGDRRPGATRQRRRRADRRDDALHLLVKPSIPTAEVEDKYSPRTVAIVALVALVVGFLLVFGGGMILLRPRARDTSALDVPPPVPRPRARPRSDAAGESSPGLPSGGDRDAATSTTTTTTATTQAGGASGSAPGDDPAAGSGGTAAGSDGGGTAAAAAREPTRAAGITIGPASTSRCFNQGSVEPIAAAQCDQLADLDRFMVTKAADIAACVRGGAHGRLMLVLDFRFSTGFMRGWGSPTSNVPNAGTVAACVKTALTPLPFSSMQHAHDRYLVTVPFDW